MEPGDKGKLQGGTLLALNHSIYDSLIVLLQTDTEDYLVVGALCLGPRQDSLD